MTRAQYQAKYGVAPTVPPVATTTAPVKMTRAEYEAKYGVPVETKIGTGNKILDANPMIKATSTNANAGKVPATAFGNPAESIKRAGEDVNAAISGEGAYAGKSALERGFSAASSAAVAVPTVVADVIPGGKAALETIGGIFDKGIKFFGNTPKMLADAAEKVGVMSKEQRLKYDENNGAFADSPVGAAIESAASIGNSAGNIANVILMAHGAAKGTQNLVDKTTVKGRTYYHGTDPDGAAGIKKNGFTASKDFPGDGMVNLTQDQAAASGYAKLKGKGEVLPVKVNPKAVKTYKSMSEYGKAVEDTGLPSGAAELAINKPYDVVVIKGDPMTGGADLVLARPSVLTLADKAPPTIFAPTTPRQARLVNKTADQIAAVENKYAKGRNANLYSKDAGGDSRQRIAGSGVLNGAVNNDGLIQTRLPGGAVEQYKAMTIKPAEGVVRQNLAREGAKVKLTVVGKSLEQVIRDSGLEGADLKTALNGVKKEISGLSIKADADGYVPTTLLHDAKINTTNNINYMTPPEVSTYRKAVARGYKQLVENNSSVNVKEINAELAKYYEDIARLERLDGGRVVGGRLGKYVAQISGTIVGGAVGGMIGGLPGVAAGTVVGGEAAGAIKGSSMSKIFTGVKDGSVPESSVLKNAIEQGKAPPLMLPPATSVFRSQIPSKGVISLPERSPSTVDAQSSTNIRQRYPAMNMSIPASSNIPDSMPQSTQKVNLRYTEEPKTGAGASKKADKAPEVVLPPKTSGKGQNTSKKGVQEGIYRYSEKPKPVTREPSAKVTNGLGGRGLEANYGDLGTQMFTTKSPISIYRGEGKGISNATLVKGRYYADSKEFASNFGTVSEAKISKGTNVFDFDAIKSDRNQTLIPQKLMVDQEALTNYLMDRGVKWTKNTNSRGVEYVELKRSPEYTLTEVAKKYDTEAAFLDDMTSIGFSQKNPEINAVMKRIYTRYSGTVGGGGSAIKDFKEIYKKAQTAIPSGGG